MTKKPKHLGFEINAVSNMLKRKALKPDNSLTKMQMWIIGFVYNKENCDVFQGDIEKTFHITRATASDILKRMERDGLITRTSSSCDARRKKIMLTDAAVQIADGVRRDIDRKELLMRQGLSDEELDTFFRVMDKIKENLSVLHDEQ